MDKSEIIYERVFKNTTLFLIGMCAYGDDIYAVSVDESVLVRFDTKDGTLHYESIIPGVAIDTYQSYHFLKIIDDTMYLVPFRANSLVKYHMKSKEMVTYDISINSKLEGEKTVHFYNMCLYKNKIYLFPFCYRAIIALDLKTGKTRECVLLDETKLKNDKVLFQPYEYINNNKIVLTSFSSNRVMMFDLETEEYKIKEIGAAEYRFTIAKKDGKFFWIFVKNEMVILKWDYENDLVEEYSLPTNCEIANDKHTFDGESIICYKDYLYAFPASANMAIRMDVNTGISEEIVALTSYCQDDRLNRELSTFNGAVQIENKMYLHYQLDMILEFNMDTNEVKEYPRILKNSPEEELKMQRDIRSYFLDKI